MGRASLSVGEVCYLTSFNYSSLRLSYSVLFEFAPKC